MSLLVFSDRCKHSIDLIQFIRQHPSLGRIVRFHNVNTQGIPNKRIERVPTLLTSDGKILVGGEVRAWLESMLPSNFSEYEDFSIGMSSLDNTETDGNIFNLDMYGQSLSPEITPELQAKIDRSMEQGMTDLKG